MLIEEVNKWLKANEAIEVVAVSESQGSRLVRRKRSLLLFDERLVQDQGLRIRD